MAFGLFVSVLACAIVSVNALKLLAATDTREDPLCNCACCNVQADKASTQWGHVVDGHQLYGCGPIFASQLFANRGFADCTLQFGREGQFCRDNSKASEPQIGLTEFCFNSCMPSTLAPKGFGQECLPVTPAVVAKAPIAAAVATSTAAPFNSRIIPLFRFSGRSPAGAPSLAGQNLVQPAQSSTPQPVAATNSSGRRWVDPVPHCGCVEVEHPVGGLLTAACLDHLGDQAQTWCYVPFGAECEPAAQRDPVVPAYARWPCNDTAPPGGPDAEGALEGWRSHSVLGAADGALEGVVQDLDTATSANEDLSTTTTGPPGWQLSEENRYCAGSTDLGPVTSATQCQERAQADVGCGPAIHSNGALCYCVPSGHACESTVTEDGNDIFTFRPHVGAVGSDVSEAVAGVHVAASVQAAAVGGSAMDSVFGR